MFRPSWLNLWVLLFAGSAVLGYRSAYDPMLGRDVLAAILGSAALYFLFAYGVHSRFVARALVVLLVAAGTLFALYFIGQFGYLNYRETPAFIQRIGRATTFLSPRYITYLHPNAAATLLAGILPLSMALFVSGQKRWFKAAAAVAVVVLAYAIVITFSRGAWLGLMAAAGIALALALLSRFSRRTAIVIVTGSTLVAVIGLAVIMLLGTERLPFLRSTFEAATSRLTLYRNTLYLATDYVFTGIGLGQTFAMVYSRFSLLIFVPFLTYAHNLPLAVWLGQGILGLVALIGLVLAFYRMVDRTMRDTQPDALFHGTWLAVTATLIHGLTDARQYVEGSWAMPALFLTIALAEALARLAFLQINQNGFTKGRGNARVAPTGNVVKRLTALVGLLAVLFIIVAYNASLRALWLTNQGALDETRTELAPDLPESEHDKLNASAVNHYQQALALDPNFPNANRRLGNLYVALGRYAAAVPLLEKAAAAEPDYPAAIKGLGLAYVWVGRTQDAARTLARLDKRRDIINELGTWSNYRREQNQPELSRYASETEVLLRLMP